jgi:hypothetical protein
LTGDFTCQLGANAAPTDENDCLIIVVERMGEVELLLKVLWRGLQPLPRRDFVEVDVFDCCTGVKGGECEEIQSTVTGECRSKEMASRFKSHLLHC